MDNNICVYQHIRVDKNEIFYIGIGNIKRSIDAYNKRRNKIWFDITSKTKYIVEILHENLSWEEACIIEIELIKQYGRKDLNTGILANLTDGGNGCVNRIFTEEHKQNISKSLTGKKLSEEHKLKMSLARKGRKLSDETKEKMRNARLGKKFKK